MDEVTRRRLEDQRACAHLRVVYTTEQIEGGLTRGWWACDLCLAKFTPVASAEYTVAQAVERCAQVADGWADSKSCQHHDDNPCCHVRTGTGIAEAIRHGSPR